jgi:hypothetical protein
MAGAFKTSCSTSGVNLHSVEGNFEVRNGMRLTRRRDSGRGVGDVHRNLGTSVLEGECRGAKDVGGIERKCGGSGLGLRDKSLNCEQGNNGG